MSKQKTYRELQFENEYVTVWKTVILPNEPLHMHQPERGRVIVPLKKGSLKKIDHEGNVSEFFFEENKAYWLEKDPEHAFQGKLNMENEPLEIMVIEVKSPEGKPLPSIPIY